MSKRKRPTPFCDDDFAYFELQSPTFRALDLHHDGGTYFVQDFQPGVYRLPIDAIKLATLKDQEARLDELIAVDACQVFLVDSGFVPRFRECLDLKKGGWPNYEYFAELRTQVGIDFGHANVASDGTYVLDLSHLIRLDPGQDPKSTKEHPKVDLYEKVARRMNTFVCEVCFDEELMGGDNTYQELAQLAKDEGWLLIPPKGKRDSWFFESFQVVGPKCAANRGVTGRGDIP